MSLVAYGASSRMARSAVNQARAKGHQGRPGPAHHPVAIPGGRSEPRGLLSAKSFLAVEMSMGQMVDDVRLAVEWQACRSTSYGRTGGMIPTPAEVLEQIEALL